jgi:hypothetical protein
MTFIDTLNMGPDEAEILHAQKNNICNYSTVASLTFLTSLTILILNLNHV